MGDAFPLGTRTGDAIRIAVPESELDFGVPSLRGANPTQNILSLQCRRFSVVSLTPRTPVSSSITARQQPPGTSPAHLDPSPCLLDGHEMNHCNMFQHTD